MIMIIIKEKTKKNGKCLKLVINRDIITQYGGKLGKLHIYIYIYMELFADNSNNVCITRENKNVMKIL